MKIAWLKDGRKVEVLDQINSSQHIVQEIFEDDEGNEVSAGEKFTAKSLLDKPLKSGYQKQVEEYREEAGKLSDDIWELRKEVREMEGLRQIHAEVLKNNSQTLAKVQGMVPFDWDFICDVMTGNVKWAVDTSHGWCTPQLFNTEMGWFNNECGHKTHGVRLISAYGKPNGKVKFTVGEYSDGSKSNTENMVFFKTDDDLHRYLTKEVSRHHEKDNLTVKDLTLVSKHITVDADIVAGVVDKTMEKAYASKEASVKYYNEELNAKIKACEALLGNLSLSTN